VRDLVEGSRTNEPEQEAGRFAMDEAGTEPASPLTAASELAISPTPPARQRLRQDLHGSPVMDAVQKNLNGTI
jgi:hypothetical protein